MHRTTEEFRRRRDALPQNVQEQAERSFALLKSNLKHPSPHFKKVGQFWSARVGQAYRALSVEDGEDFIWVWIGAHDQYERITRERP